MSCKSLIIDTETTGVDPTEDRVVEYAWMRVRLPDCYVLDFDSAFANPGRAIPPEASAIHHITKADVETAPPLPAEAWWRDLAGECDYVIAHHADFDRQFVPNLARPWICTWRCALHLWPEAPSHSLQVLRYWLDLLVDPPANLAPHRALYDVACTGPLVRRMLQEADGPERLLELSTKPVVLRKVRFGKHRGQLWSEVPHDYLRWLLSKDFDEDVQHTARHYLGVS